MPYFEVFEATDGLKALNLVVSKPVNFFAAVILDLNMPVMNGYDACDLIHSYLYPEENANILKDDKH